MAHVLGENVERMFAYSLPLATDGSFRLRRRPLSPTPPQPHDWNVVDTTWDRYAADADDILQSQQLFGDGPRAAVISPERIHARLRVLRRHARDFKRLLPTTEAAQWVFLARYRKSLQLMCLLDIGVTQPQAMVD
ncbi:hypothetical protein C8R47DRAFT_1212806 [Mycena vitilis]|nr:hypothetical protein C8R47DRAFT_1212806 [Mycena vitilis]